MSSTSPGPGSVARAVASSSTEQSPEPGSAAHNLPRIHLRALPVDEAAALLAGSGHPGPGVRWHEEYPMAETLDALGMLWAAHAATGWSAARIPHWWLHQIVLDHLVVGDIGFHGPPSSDGGVEVEIGYNVVSGRRGEGIATSACRSLLELAWRDGATVVRAETEPGNTASQHVLHSSGFQASGYLRYVIERPRATGGHR